MKKKIGHILLWVIVAVQLISFQNKFDLSDFQQNSAEIYRQMYICDEEGKGWDG